MTTPLDPIQDALEELRDVEPWEDSSDWLDRRTNRGKTYTLRQPVPAKGTWEPWLFNKTWEALLSLRSWVAFGVYRSLCLRAKTSGQCIADRGELAAEVGCAESAVQKAIAALIKLKLIDRVGGPARRGKLARFKVAGYRRGKDSGYSITSAAN